MGLLCRGVLVGFQSSLGNETVSRALASLNTAWDPEHSEIPRNEHCQLQFILSLNASVRYEKQIILQLNSAAPFLSTSLSLPCRGLSVAP